MSNQNRVRVKEGYGRELAGEVQKEQDTPHPKSLTCAFVRQREKERRPERCLVHEHGDSDMHSEAQRTNKRQTLEYLS